ncbi:acetylornithine deacetylase [Pseudodonghicola flavimaris]|uniref:Acetylornithine deacetylase n=1 Tax=Pseudodonghicola flavimaris TaxID=3050036 RepID=A0ABT7EYJ4_9RHOB|nr:acetylornithine deacetylase [Pseudodonghicola flavimaris]MDK3017411.1 acetylornithine deacetylase [Pseudodonghicola flavimaris]
MTPDPLHARLRDLLARLIGFETVAGSSNRDLIDWAAALLQAAGFTTRIVPSQDGTRAGLLARFGAGAGGLMLSAHTDVVPVAGQSWSIDPFALGERQGRYFGRGTTDMKGFVACVLTLAESLRQTPPARPVSIVLSWDEEIGCRGIPEMIDAVLPTLGRPDLCIVGEPTSLRLGTGHKGKASYRAVSRGQAGHSAMAPQYRNALHPAAETILALRDAQTRLQQAGAQDPAYDPPCSTVHAGVMRGGSALNIVPDRAEIDFEIRHLAAETAADILAGIDVPEGVEVTLTGSYPGLDTDPALPAVATFAGLLRDAAPVRLAFGTEAGFFAARGIPTVVCGPGTMRDGHQPDESIAVQELHDGLDLLRRAVYLFA